ncbi:MAG: DUF1415 domain-containing protein [Arenimonas sp.]
MASAFEDPAIVRTRHWLETAVIGLNLCPFAKAVHVRGQVRYVLSSATDETTLLADLVHELESLQDADPERVETTLLVHPRVLGDFLDYNQFLELADAAVSELELEGEIQVASFHPDYRFAGSAADDIDNFSNRAPYPTLHLLRESSVARAVAAFPDAARIYERNIDTLRALGHAGWRALWTAPGGD